MNQGPMERLNIAIDVYRQRDDPHFVLVCFSQDYHSEQRHLLKSTGVPVSPESIKECLAKIVSRLVEGSVFNDASPSRAAPAFQSVQER